MLTHVNQKKAIKLFKARRKATQALEAIDITPLRVLKTKLTDNTELLASTEAETAPIAKYADAQAALTTLAAPN